MHSAITTASSVLAASDDPGAALAGWATILIGILVLLPIVLFVAALISILSSPRYTGGGKLLWVVLVLCLPLLGPLGWFLAGRNAVIRTTAP